MNINQLFTNESDISLENYLKANGIDDVKKYIKPDKSCIEPFEHYDNMDKAVDMLNLDNKIYILVDCDVDGFLSASMLYCYLRSLNKSINIFPLFHNDKSHGLDNNIISQIENDSLLIIPDASGSEEQYKTLCDKNVSVTVLDHHDISNSNYAAIVNNQLSSNVQNKYLSGCGVTHKFLQALDAKYNKQLSGKYISYVAISIVSDSMNVTSLENRAYLCYGLQKIHPNIKPFTDEWIKGDITPHELSFHLINRFNALVRSDNQDGKINLFNCLCGNGNYTQAISDCTKAHKQQTEYVKQKFQEILPTVNTDNQVAFCLTDEQSSYTGLIANKLMSELNKPVLLVYKKDNEYMGSARSPVDIKTKLYDSGLMTICAGHEAALGVAWDENNTKPLISYCNTLDLPEPSETVVYSYSNEIIPDRVFNIFHDDRIVPDGVLWGMGLQCPQWNIHIDNIDSAIIQQLKGATIKFQYNDCTFIKFFVSNKEKQNYFLDINTKIDIDIIGELGYNNFMGKQSKQCVISKMECKEHKEKEIDWDELFK